MKLLILGGTRFLGRHLVLAARANGHAVTLFNRGRTAPGLFAGVEQLRGDRDGGLDALGDRSWDAVIDTCGYVPRVVRQSVTRMAARASCYLFVSSVSVYSDFSRTGIAEDAPVSPLADPATEDILPNYGALKAACETLVRDTFGRRSLIVRPGLIVGPHDPTDRFAYWVRRCARGGPMLVPDAPDYPVQFIDVRDLAQWMIALLDRRRAGTFNAIGPRQALTLSGFLSACVRVTGADARPVRVATDFLAQQGVQPWTDLPLWAGDDDAGIAQIDGSRAWTAGLANRPVDDTIVATLEWLAERGNPESPGGLDPEREAALLAVWARPLR